jgi:DNA mismatch repair protein MutS
LTETLTLLDLAKLEKVKFTSRAGSKKQTLECDDSFINPGCDPEIDQIQTHLRQYQSYLEAVCQHLNDLLRGTRTKKIELLIERAKTTQEEEGVQAGQLTVLLHTTPAGVKSIRAGQVNLQLCGTLEFHEMRAKSKTMITSEIIRQASYGFEVSQGLLEQKLLARYNDVVAKIGQRSYFKRLSEFIAMVDFLKSNAQMALKYKYSRPIIDRTAKTHFFEMKGLRHPLIERIIRSEYIPNDISLGEGGPLGLLLLGVNAAGKSSRIKAVPSVISMAQAGLYVPCDLLRFYPASRIITRLSGHDDLLGGKSSFVVEATELRTILRNADANTLVIGDELCRGTEITSGTSLTVQTIVTLIKRGVKFMFATHMHHLPKINLIRDLIQSKQLQIAHLTAVYNEAISQMIYGRKLEEGPGSSIYGLEVCKSLKIDREFLEGADKIRREIEQIPDLFQSTKRSRYGDGIYVDHCLLCGRQVRLQTHHIQEQSKADEQGFIGHYHKDSVFNQMTLCEFCHPQLHHLKQQIVTQQTLTGTYLMVQGSK